MTSYMQSWRTFVACCMCLDISVSCLRKHASHSFLLAVRRPPRYPFPTTGSLQGFIMAERAANIPLMTAEEPVVGREDRVDSEDEASPM